MLKKILVPTVLGIMLSMYFFPIGFTFLPPNVNSKMILAALGVLLFVIECIKERKVTFKKDIFISALFALLFSFICYISIIVNGTDDVSYAQYYMSFAVWLGGAYAVVTLMRGWYGEVSIHLIARYLAWVGVGQAVSALLIDNIPAFSQFVDSFMEIGQAHLKNINRKYGIGSALDPGGVRFAIILVMLSFELCTSVFNEKKGWLTVWYVFSFFIITVVGNMISRTTTSGAVLGLAYIVYYMISIGNGVLSSKKIRTWGIIIAVLAVVIPIVTYLYNTDENMHSSLRFAFEGFFNWAETGEWRTDSTDKLNNVMWIWPKDPRSWFIGTGLFEGFIYSTDIGYCRFVLYCGLLGLSIFSLFFIYNAIAVWQKFEKSFFLAAMLLALVFIIWIKVATDIFLVFALLLCIDGDFESEEIEDVDEENEDIEPKKYFGVAQGILD